MKSQIDEVKERPILFSTNFIPEILDGIKTSTRRIVKGPALEWLEDSGFTPEFVASSENDMCPLGKIGDQLWVRETHAIIPKTAYWHDQTIPHIENDDQWSVYKAGWNRVGLTWKPSIHMPRWASRIQLEITKVRIERMQDGGDREFWGEDKWSANPWVWVVEFKVIKGSGK